VVPLTHPAPLAAAVTDFLRHEVPGTLRV